MTLGPTEVTAVAAAPLGDRPCTPYITPGELIGDSEDGLDADPVKVQAACDMASAVLYGLTGRQYSSGCTARLRPCCCDELAAIGVDHWRSWGYVDPWESSYGFGGTPPWTPEIIAGQWYNLGGGTRCRPYACGQVLERLDLGLTAVTETIVTIGGVVLDPAAYRIDRNRYLTRRDGQPWPPTNNLTADDDAPGVWRVDVAYGTPPPPAVLFAARELGTELLKHSVPGKQCTLPLRVTQVNKQGINYTLANVMEVVKDGGTGLYWVDLVVTATNPAKLAQRPRVLTPGRRRIHHPQVGRPS